MESGFRVLNSRLQKVASANQHVHLFPWRNCVRQGETYCTYGCMAFFQAEAGRRIWAFFRLSWAS